VRHKITVKDIKPNPKNIEKIKNAKISNSITELKRFLKTTQFYKQFMKNYTNIARSIYNMLRDNILEY